MKCFFCGSRFFVSIGLFCASMIPSLEAFAFDCAKASTRVEKLICADKKLVELDRELNKLYREASKREPQGIKVEQRQWLKSRNSCPDVACVSAAYEDRVDELKSFIRAWDKDIAAAARIEKEERSSTQQFTPDSKQKDILALMHRGALCAGFYSRYLPGESPRVLRRLQPLRRWSYEQTNKVFPGAARACDSHGLRAA